MCSHEKRTAIERAAAGGTDDVIKAAAQKFTISSAALSKHMATHLRAPAPAAAPPNVAARRRGRAPSPPPEVLEDAEPVTSRSEDLAPSGPKRVSARDQFEEVLVEIRSLLEEATQDQVVGTDENGKPIFGRAPLPERATVVRTAMSAVRLLANLTGELGASESAIVTSGHWKRFEGELLYILKAHPAALADVVGWLEKKRDAA